MPGLCHLEGDHRRLRSNRGEEGNRHDAGFYSGGKKATTKVEMHSRRFRERRVKRSTSPLRHSGGREEEGNLRRACNSGLTDWNRDLKEAAAAARGRGGEEEDSQAVQRGSTASLFNLFNIQFVYSNRRQRRRRPTETLRHCRTHAAEW